MIIGVKIAHLNDMTKSFSVQNETHIQKSHVCIA